MTENLPKDLVLTKGDVGSELAVLGGVDVDDIIKLWRGIVPLTPLPSLFVRTERQRTDYNVPSSIQHKQFYSTGWSRTTARKLLLENLEQQAHLQLSLWFHFSYLIRAHI